MIELMVATAILVIIVLIMSQIYHQSAVAFDGGMRKAEGNMMARAALGLMAREIRDAVAHPDQLSESEISPLGNAITIHTLTRDATEGRVARKIQYALQGDEIIRTVWVCDLRRYGDWTDPTKSAIAENVKQLRFVRLGTTPMSDSTLPNGVEIQMEVSRKEDVSGVGAESAGPNGQWGDGDDIRSF